ncbi:hypothetical protein [Candidatus Nitrospira bockiana]
MRPTVYLRTAPHVTEGMLTPLFRACPPHDKRSATSVHGTLWQLAFGTLEEARAAVALFEHSRLATEGSLSVTEGESLEGQRLASIFAELTQSALRAYRWKSAG